VFLDLNGIEIEDHQERFYQAMIDVSAKKLDKKKLAELFSALRVL